MGGALSGACRVGACSAEVVEAYNQAVADYYELRKVARYLGRNRWPKPWAILYGRICWRFLQKKGFFER